MVAHMNTEKKKGILLMAGALAVLVFAYVLYQTSSNTQPEEQPNATSTIPVATTTTNIFDMEPIVPEAKVSTEGWKTCRNEEYGYEFKFPGEWKIYGEDALSEPNPHPISKRVYVRESEECNGASVFLSAFEPWNGAVATSGDGGMYVEVRPSTLNKDKYWRNYLVKVSGRTHQYIELDKNKAVLGVSSWARVDGSRAWGVGSYSQQKVFRLYGSFFDEQSPNIYTILSTFRFLNISSTTSTSTAE